MTELYLTPEDNLEAAFASLAPYTHVHLAEGTYRAKLVLTQSHIHISGAGMDKTVIVWDDYAKKLDQNGQELITFRSYTVAVLGDFVEFSDLCIENDAGSPAKLGQEVALSVYGTRFRAFACRFRSTQDTLFLGPLPADLIARYDGLLRDELRADKPCSQYFHSCQIEGSVDFIFGCGHALFDRCDIKSINDGRDTGYVAAPAHAKSHHAGFVFLNCVFSQKDVQPGSVYLARPWRDYGRAEFVNCQYGPHIAPAGFDPWADSGREKTAHFGEYNGYGTGETAAKKRVPWAKALSYDQAVAAVLGVLPLVLSRKKIKNINLYVRRDDASLIITMPERLPLSSLSGFLESRRSWILKTQERILHLPQISRVASLNIAPESTVCIWGKPYRLTLVQSPVSSLAFEQDRLLVMLPDAANVELAKLIIQNYLRAQLKAAIEERLPLWEQKTGFFCSDWGVRDSKTRFGSCQTQTGRLSFALSLAQYDPAALDYVILHELCHLREPNHGAPFKRLLDRFMPDWRTREEYLQGRSETVNKDNML